MTEKKLDADTIYTVSRNSNWSEKGIAKAFSEAGIYPQMPAWRKFIEIALLVLGVGFTAAGIIFFFAYNWAHIHRFAKLGIIEALIIITVIIAMNPALKPLAKNIVLTGSSLLVGCLFAVFGQVYQTGANAYDFFLGWTAFVLLWCIAGAFPPLWLLFLGLVNATLILYHEQVAGNWSTGFILTLLFLVNALPVVFAELFVRLPRTILQKWFIRIASLAALTYSTIAICNAIFDTRDGWSVLITLLSLAFGAAAILHGLRSKNLFYLMVVPLSAIIIISALITEGVDHDFISGLLLIALFIGGSNTVLIRQLLKLNKSWNGQQLNGG